MLYYYKRPSDWLWISWETSSLEEDANDRRLKSGWRFRIDGDSEDYSLAELIEKERARQFTKILDSAEAFFSRAGWQVGVTSVVLSLAYISILLFAPTQNGLSGLKFILIGTALVWLGSGIRKIKAARAWKRHHLHKT